MFLRVLTRNKSSKTVTAAFKVLSVSAALLITGCNLEMGRSSSSSSGSVTLSWSQPTERVNGSPLTDDDISGYTIRFRSSSNVRFNTIFVENCRSNSCSYKVDDLRNPSEYEFQVAAVDSVGLHSEFVSAED